jgi:iron complex outermembrane receptor protein
VFGNNFIYGFPQHTISSTKGAFTQGTYKITDLRLTAASATPPTIFRAMATPCTSTRWPPPLVGGQYTLDPAAGGGRSYVNDATVKGRKVTWRVGFDADVLSGLLYGSIASATRSAASATVLHRRRRPVAGHLAGRALRLFHGRDRHHTLKYGDQKAIYYEPETLIDYELGFRGRVTPWMKIDTNLFLYDYKNMQLSAVIPVNGANQTVTTNAARRACWAGNSRRSSSRRAIST